MKELRTTTGGRSLRILFAFDPHREAILLVGGDKTNRWNRWYRKMIPVADGLLDRHLGELQQKGAAPKGPTT